ncbi:unnamed protein product [Clonostachys solani]|uniref:Uncharacterized protein n=1 Tax=Clonostachys solani TaxID=160281 RepID=A0A9N9ZC85_9HYPO|nr:unnamed protein product [Clonostachys solani]
MAAGLNIASRGNRALSSTSSKLLDMPQSVRQSPRAASVVRVVLCPSKPFLPCLASSSSVLQPSRALVPISDEADLDGPGLAQAVVFLRTIPSSIQPPKLRSPSCHKRYHDRLASPGIYPGPGG